ncbi:MAG: hypothetical protein JWQ27_2631 [Ferruginibacter sp.]|nr:hypothetical protein [Ferruginibacter sp.]
MQYKTVKGFSGFGQLGMLVLFLGLGFILAAAVQLVIAFQMLPAGTSLDKLDKVLMKAMLDPDNIGLARLSQVLGTLCLLFIPAVLYSWVTNGRDKFWLGFNPWLNGYQVVIGFFIIFAANIMAAPLADLSKAVIAHFPKIDASAKEMERLYNEQVLALSNLRNWPEYLMALVIMAFFPAMFEEVFFRGAMQNLLVRWWKMPLLAIIFTSLVFSLIHMSVYLFISRAVLGFVLGLIYHKTKNIWVNIIAHFLNNAIAVTQLFWLSQQKKKIDVDQLDMKTDWWMALLALAFLIFMFRLLDKYSVKNREKIMAKETLLIEKEDPFRSFTSK